jgi:DnaK suppressor protein
MPKRAPRWVVPGKNEKGLAVAKKVTRKAAVVGKTLKRPLKRPPLIVDRKAAPKVKAAPVIIGKSPLGKAELEHFRKLLIDKRRSIIGDMNGIQAEALGTNRQDGSGDLSNMPTHPADIGTDNFEQEFSLGLLESERILLTEITEALERIKKGTYGVCLGTGEAIGKARLEARPWAKYCIDYQRLMEKGLVRPQDNRAEGEEGEEGEEVDGESEAEGDTDADSEAEVEAPDEEAEVEEEPED